VVGMEVKVEGEGGWGEEGKGSLISLGVGRGGEVAISD
jgi:hypothetical protein